MSQPPKLLFDECVGWPAVQQLAALVGVTSDEVPMGHAVRMRFGSTNDEIWIPQIAHDGWTIITADRGRRPKKGRGEKLPIVCRNNRVTCVAFSRSYHHKRVFEKLRILLHVWDELLEIASQHEGAGYSLRPSGSGHPTLVRVMEPLPVEPDGGPQRELL